MNHETMLKKQAGSRRPARVVTLPLSAWAETTDRPAAPLPIGLRSPSEAARASAQREANDAIGQLDPAADEQDRVIAYNRALRCELLAYSATLAVDVSAPFFTSALEVAHRLTHEGAKRLFEEVEILILGSDASMPEATDEGFSHLIAMWDRGVAFERMQAEDSGQLRRLVEYVRQRMAEEEERADRAGVVVA